MRRDDISLALLVFRYLWPFWLFKDASRGDAYARAAAYQHNRRQRVYLPAYLAKWLLVCALTLTFTMHFETLAADMKNMSTVFDYLAAGAGIGFTFGICVLMKIGYVYLYLSGQMH